MKVSKFYFPLAAAALLASCSNESEPVDNGGTTGGELRYLAVNICNPSAAGTRADATYEFGTPGENGVTSALFIVAKGDNIEYVTTSTDINWTDQTTGGNVARIGSAVIVVPNIKTDPNAEGVADRENYNLIAILNPTDDITKLAEKDGSLQKIEELSGNFGSFADNSFVMSNSVYNGSGKHLSVPASYFRHTAAEAELNPVDVYVERTVAKVKYPLTVGNNKGADQELGATTEKKHFIIDIKGIDLTYTANESNLLKDVSSIPEGWSTWSGDHRSYWASETSEKITRLNWNQIKFEENSNEASEVKYIQENTLSKGVKLDGVANSSTYVIVAAKLKAAADENDKVGEDISALVEFNGLYYLDGDNTHKDGRKAVVSSAAKNITLKEGAEGLNENDIEFVTNKTTIKWDVEWSQSENASYTTYAVLTDSGKTKVADETAANNVLKGMPVKYWNGGMCYYYAQIAHNGHELLGMGENEPDLYGIVRNHVYNLEFDAIGGLGTPVIDPSNPIIPDTPGNDPSKWFLAARVKVLQWRVLPTQNINFGK